MTEDDCFFFKYPEWQFSSQLWHKKLFVSLCCVGLTFWRRMIPVVVEVGALKTSRVVGLVTGWDGAGLSWLWGCPPPPSLSPSLVHPGWAFITFGWCFKLQSCWLKPVVVDTCGGFSLWPYADSLCQSLCYAEDWRPSRCASLSDRGVIHLCLFFSLIKNLCSYDITVFSIHFYYFLIVDRPLRLLHSQIAFFFLSPHWGLHDLSHSKGRKYIVVSGV